MLILCNLFDKFIKLFFLAYLRRRIIAFTDAVGEGPHFKESPFKTVSLQVILPPF